MSDPADEPALVPEPVAPLDEFDVPPGQERDTILTELCLNDIYEDRCGSMLKVPVHAKHSELYTEYQTSKSRDEKLADCHSIEHKKYKAYLPNRGILGKSESHLFKDHLVSKAVTQASLSKCYDRAHVEKCGVLVINVATIIDEPIRFAYHGKSDSVIVVMSTDIDRIPGQGARRRMLLDIVKRVGDASAEWLRKPGADALHELGLVDYEAVRVRNPPKGEPDGTGAQKGKKKGEWDATHARMDKGKDLGKGYKGSKFGKGPEFGKNFDFGKFGAPFDPYFSKPKGFGKFDAYFDSYYGGKNGKSKSKSDSYQRDYLWPHSDDWHLVGKDSDDYGFGKPKGASGEWGPAHTGKGPPTDPTATSRDSSSYTGPPKANRKIFTMGAEYIESGIELLLTDPRIKAECFVDCLSLSDSGGNKPTKHETGLDHTLREKLRRQAGFRELCVQATGILEEHGVLVLWCRHGFHRSVGIAEVLRGELPDVQCLHLTIHRHKDRYERDRSTSLWVPKMTYPAMKRAMEEFAETVIAGLRDDRAELQEQLYNSELENAELKARNRVLEKNLSGSKGVESHDSKDPPKGKSGSGGSDSAPKKDPKEIADKFLTSVLQPTKYQYMRTEGLCTYDGDGSQLYMCALCTGWDEAERTCTYIHPVSAVHLESGVHLRNVSWHCYMKREYQMGDWYRELAERAEYREGWQEVTAKRRKKGQ